MDTKKTMKRRLIGTIVSDRMTKTRVVEVARTGFVAKYEKSFPATTRVKCHDEKNEYRAGDIVVIEECRPLSKDKHWMIVGKQ